MCLWVSIIEVLCLMMMIMMMMKIMMMVIILMMIMIIYIIVFVLVTVTARVAENLETIIQIETIKTLFCSEGRCKKIYIFKGGLR